MDLGLPLLVVWCHSDPSGTDLGLPLPVVWRHSDPNETDLGLPLLVVWHHTPMERTWACHSWWSGATAIPMKRTWAYHSRWSGATSQWNGPGPATPGDLAPHPCNNFLSVCISKFQSILHLFNSFCTQLLMNVSNQHLNLSMNTKHHAHVQQREQMGRYSR